MIIWICFWVCSVAFMYHCVDIWLYPTWTVSINQSINHILSSLIGLKKDQTYIISYGSFLDFHYAILNYHIDRRWYVCTWKTDLLSALTGFDDFQEEEKDRPERQHSYSDATTVFEQERDQATDSCCSRACLSWRKGIWQDFEARWWREGCIHEESLRLAGQQRRWEGCSPSLELDEYRSDLQLMGWWHRSKSNSVIFCELTCSPTTGSCRAMGMRVTLAICQMIEPLAWHISFRHRNWEKSEQLSLRSQGLWYQLQDLLIPLETKDVVWSDFLSNTVLELDFERWN